jgi:hypothetical protein
MIDTRGLHEPCRALAEIADYAASTLSNSLGCAAQNPVAGLADCPVRKVQGPR